MLSYQLAKQLKEAGFPQGKSMGVYLAITRKKILHPKTGKWHIRKAENKLVYSRDAKAAFPKSEWVACPTLIELIEACGEEVGLFKISSTECNAWSKKMDKIVDDESNDFQYFRGSTPEEAVANLWLALNKK